MNPELPSMTGLGPTRRGTSAEHLRVPFSDVRILGGPPEGFETLFPPAAVQFLGELARRFAPHRDRLLRERREFFRRVQTGETLGYLPETRAVRDADWFVPPPPGDLSVRHVEITAPTDAKRVVRALNCGANVFMADFEDAHAPEWSATLRGQLNLRAAVRRTLAYRSPTGERFRIVPQPATLVVRPRGWHLDEPHLFVDGQAIPAALFDAGLFLFHNAHELLHRGTGPYLYLPKLEHHAEAGLWNDVFRYAESQLRLARAAIRPTVLVETVPAIFEMDEILFQLRERCLGLNLGRWDYIFSFIKLFRDDPSVVFPDRSALTMETPFLSSAARLLVRAAHRRGAQAIGGMAADVPSRDDPAATARAVERVVADKSREVRQGFDGTWVAHPDLVEPAREVFARAAGRPTGEGVSVFRSIGARELLAVPSGPITDGGMRTNVRVALRYLTAWLGGVGAVAIDHRMEDLATFEISRAQIWHWVRHGAPLTRGPPVGTAVVRELIGEELDVLVHESRADVDGAERAHRAATLLDELTTGRAFPEFFPLVAQPEAAASPEEA